MINDDVDVDDDDDDVDDDDDDDDDDIYPVDNGTAVYTTTSQAIALTYHQAKV